jgi:hypothetical protein
MLRSSRTGPTKIGTFSRASAVIVGALVALFGVVAGPLLGVFAAPSASAATTGSGYTAITPFRALGGSAAGSGVVVASGTPVNVAIVGNTVAPAAVPAGATAVVLDVTASTPTAAGYLTVYPQGGTNPGTSNVNFTANETVANLVTVPLSTAGGITIAEGFTGQANVDVDVEGYYSASGAGLYNPTSPNRVSGANGTSIAAGATTAFTVTGNGVPTSATAVVVNLTASAGTASSYLSAYAAGVTPAPTGSSSLNFTAGSQAVANRDIVNVGAAGQIDVFNLAGIVNVDVDVDGYYAGSGSTFVALAAPIRLTDTRVPMNGSSIGSGVTETFNLTTAASTIPTTATAVAANFTVVPGAAPGYITVFPTATSTTPPNASDINWPASSGSAAVANYTQADTAGTPTGSVQVFNLNSGSPVDLVIDAFGYFTTGTNVTSNNVNIGVPSTSPNTISVVDLSSNTKTVTATVTNGTGGAVVNGDSVAFTLAPAGCGSFSATPVTTNSSGVAVATYVPPAFTSGTTPTTCTVTAKDAIFGQTGTAVITLTAPPNSIALSPAATHLAANGTSTDLLTATVTAGATGTANNDAVTFTTSGTCGTVGAPSGTTGPTNAANVTATYTAGTNAGFCTVTATEAANGATASTTIDQTSSPALAAATVAVTPTTATTTFGGTAAFSVAVTNTGGALAGDQVVLTAVPGTSGQTCGTISPASGVTNSSGVITATYTASTTPTIDTACTFTALEADTNATGTAAITQVAAAPVVVTATTGNAGNNVPVGTSTAITVSASNVTNALENGGAVTFAFSGSSTGCGSAPASTTLAVASGATTGTATSSYTAGTTVGATCTIVASVSNTASTPAVVGTATIAPPIDQVA